MAKKSPKEVFWVISKDLKQRGLTHADAASILGYSNKQSLSNLLSQDKYLSPVQANNFHSHFQYSKPFLQEGEGCLYDSEIAETDHPRYYYHDMNNLVHLNDTDNSENMMILLRSFLRRIIRAWGHPDALKLLDIYRQYEACSDMESLLRCVAEAEHCLDQLETNSMNKN